MNEFIQVVLLLVLIGCFARVQAADTHAPAPAAAPLAPQISGGVADTNGWLVHTVTCEYEAGETRIRVLLPRVLAPEKRYRVLYLLPVEPLDPITWGDGLQEARKLDLSNKYGLICVFPTFSHCPWYADHPTDPAIRQESYLLKVVLPFIEREYPAIPKPEGRLLVGFSKSGWGAFSLILRHPDVFGKAAAWDVPFSINTPNVWGMGDIFQTQANFEQYEITRLLNKQADVFRKPPPRLILMGYGYFKVPVKKTHDLLVQLGIPHEYQPEPKREHRWDSGWVGPTVELLVKE